MLCLSGLITLFHHSLWSLLGVQCLLTYKSLSTWYSIWWAPYWAQALVVSGPRHRRVCSVKESRRYQQAAGSQTTLRAIRSKVSPLLPKWDRQLCVQIGYPSLVHFGFVPACLHWQDRIQKKWKEGKEIKMYQSMTVFLHQLPKSFQVSSLPTTTIVLPYFTQRSTHPELRLCQTPHCAQPEAV